MNVLFICTGNTCRSPMAEALFKKVTGSDGSISQMQISSAGIFASADGNINNMAAKILKEIYDIDYSDFRSRNITEEMINSADLILTMEKSHKDYIISKWRNSEGRVFTINEYSGNAICQDIPDPFGGSYETYLKCAELIMNALEKIKNN